ncbi:MAG: hypothetical protein HY042_01230, partial [Spirochaetia bacterium]|nr:hypothetical protein [Spirochaetia bacterium]
MAARISARRPGRLLCLALVLVFFEAVSGCRPPPDPYRLTGFAFGSTYSVTLDETDPATQGISDALDSE